jgi:hypothetical protein
VRAVPQTVHAVPRLMDGVNTPPSLGRLQMATTIDSVITTGSTREHNHRGVLAVAVGVFVAAVLAGSAIVIADDSDSTGPATTPPAATEVGVNDDPLMMRFGAGSGESSADHQAEIWQMKQSELA